MTTAVSQTDRPLRATPGAQGLAGTRFKHQHLSAILADGLSNGFFEVHAENHMSVGGRSHRTLAAICEHYFRSAFTASVCRMAATRKMHS
ncbi:DUF692 family multinuclear iron-containing protein [Paraburkholderia sp. BL6665CI2N2]|uniref:multinuclear nonheme iron-dependent oxidase n=1 Tax=Paraburkholderia sp. BL6665CI2N2 TaxID=1938806 RepID=UPI001FB93C54|nr:DUF692 family multinuclear iron-containing protein [Paraburkholderia sp. BL6665CI2N2]